MGIMSELSNPNDYPNEIKFLSNLSKWLKPNLKRIKTGALKPLKIKTVKICLVLDDGIHMHKDINFGGL